MQCVKVTMWSGMQCMTLSSTFTMYNAFYDPCSGPKEVQNICPDVSMTGLLQGDLGQNGIQVL